MNKIDYLEKELSRLLEWIKSADTRISLILPLSTAMLGAIAALAPNESAWTVGSGISVAFTTFFLLSSIFSVAMASFPRTNGPKGSLIFFSGINSKELDQFRANVDSMSEDSYKNDLINQCHINAQIAETKFFWIKKSIMFLFASSIPWFFSIYYLYGVIENG